LAENLIYKLRKKLFASIIYKHIAWFDSRAKAPGVLSNILSEDITELNGLSVETLSTIIEAVLALVIGIVLALTYNW